MIGYTLFLILLNVLVIASMLEDAGTLPRPAWVVKGTIEAPRYEGVTRGDFFRVFGKKKIPTTEWNALYHSVVAPWPPQMRWGIMDVLKSCSPFQAWDFLANFNTPIPERIAILEKRVTDHHLAIEETWSHPSFASIQEKVVACNKLEKMILDAEDEIFSLCNELD